NIHLSRSFSAGTMRGSRRAIQDNRRCCTGTTTTPKSTPTDGRGRDGSARPSVSIRVVTGGSPHCVCPTSVCSRAERFDSLLVLQRGCHARATATLHAYGPRPWTESVELDAHFVRAFRNIRD